MPQGGIGAALQLMQPCHGARAQVRLGVLCNPLLGEGFKFDVAITRSLGSALFVKENGLTVQLLLNLLGGHTRSGFPCHGALHLPPGQIIAARCPDQIAGAGLAFTLFDCCHISSLSLCAQM